MGEGRIRRWLYLGIWLAAAALYLLLFVPQAVLFGFAWLDRGWWADPGRVGQLGTFVGYLAGIGGILYTFDHFVGSKGGRSAAGGSPASAGPAAPPERPAPAAPDPTPPDHTNPALPADIDTRRLLQIRLGLGPAGLHRAFRAGGAVLDVQPGPAPPTDLAELRADAHRAAPPAEREQTLGAALYRLLFCERDIDHFPALAHAAWGEPADAAPSQAAVSVALQWDPADGDPWPLALPWNLTRDRHPDAGPPLAAAGWLFEAVPPGVVAERAQALLPQPPVLLLIDARADGADAHAAELQQQIDRDCGLGFPALHCDQLDRVRERVHATPAPEVLYVYARTSLDLAALAAALGDALPLILLNLIGEDLPAPPPELVRERKVILCGHAGIEAAQARGAGRRWLLALLTDYSRACPLRAAVDQLGPRVRLWSGCAGLTRDVSLLRGRRFDRSLIRLLLDRVSARREVSDEVAAALNKGKGVVALVAAGTASDHPELLPRQVWHHYIHYAGPGERDIPCRFPLATGALPDADELLLRFARALEIVRRDDWIDAVERRVGDLAGDEQYLLSLEWQVPARPLEPGIDPADWRRQWLDAWLDFGLRLTEYRRTGVLIVNMLIVAPDAPQPAPAAPPAAEAAAQAAAEAAAEAAAWCRQARERWWARGPHGAAGARERFLLLELEPLSKVPEKDLRYFFDQHYDLAKHYPDLPVEWLAHWIAEQSQGDFKATAALVERLHDDNFKAARDALASLPRTG
jgi:hypothetical protein